MKINEVMENMENTLMQNLRSGDILINIKDGSKWEFSRYSYGKITHRADIPSEDFIQDKDYGFDKVRVCVRPLDENGIVMKDEPCKDLWTSNFRKA